MSILSKFLIIAITVISSPTSVYISVANVDGAKYFVNTKRQASSVGKHFEVHREGCGYLKRCKNCEYIGTFPNCSSALIAAKNKVKVPSAVDGCSACAGTWNTD